MNRYQVIYTYADGGTETEYHDESTIREAVHQGLMRPSAITAERHDYNALDGYYSCSQAEDPDPAPGEGGPGSGCSDPERRGKPCDCGRDARVARLLGIIASEWKD